MDCHVIVIQAMADHQEVLPIIHLLVALQSRLKLNLNLRSLLRATVKLVPLR